MYITSKNTVKMINLYSMENVSNTLSETNENTPFTNRFLLKGFTTGQNKWWMYLLGILAAFLGYLVFQSIMIFPLMAMAMKNGITMNEITQNPNLLFNPEVVGINRSVLLALMMGMFVFCLLFLWLAIKFIQKKSLVSIASGFEKFRWSRYFTSFGIWSVLLVGLTVVSYLSAPEEMTLQFDFGKFIVLLIVAVLLIPIQTATEEFIFRGYLMQGFGLMFKNGIAPLIITSVLFGLMHASNPEAKAHGLLLMMPYYIFFGAFLGLLTLLDEGAELAMGIHCANNLMSSLLVCSKNSVLQTDAIFYTNSENPGGEFFIWFVMASICFFILYKKYKLNNWSLLKR